MDPCVRSQSATRPRASEGQPGPARERGAPLAQSPEARGTGAAATPSPSTRRAHRDEVVDRVGRVHVDVGAHVGDRIMEADATELSPNPVQLQGPAGQLSGLLPSCTSVCPDARYDAPSVCYFYKARQMLASVPHQFCFFSRTCTCFVKKKFRSFTRLTSHYGEVLREIGLNTTTRHC
jgi:hypothetical protein